MLSQIIDDMLRHNATAAMIAAVAKGIIDRLESQASKQTSKPDAKQRRSSDLFAKQRQPRKTFLPDDFLLPLECRDFAVNQGWDQQRIDAEFSRFTDHARATARMSDDWVAAWRLWVTSPYQKQLRPTPVASVTDMKTARKERVTDALDRLGDYVDRHRSSGAGQGDALGLSQSRLPRP